MILLCATIALTFFDLEKELEPLENQQVAIVGFLARNQHNEWFLAKQPNIKSCCLAKSRAIALKGDFPEKLVNQRVKVEGVFQLSMGEITLEHPKLVR